MKLTHVLLAALLALPLGLTGCDANEPDANLSTAPLAALSASASPEASGVDAKGGGAISGPTTILLGGLAEYDAEGVDSLYVKNRGGKAEVEYQGTRPGDGVPIRFIGIRAIQAGDIQIQGHHPQFGWFYLTVIIQGPDGDTCAGEAGEISGPSSLQLNQTATFSATCAQNIRAGIQSAGSVQILSQTQGTDTSGRPTVQAVIKGTAEGRVRLRSKLTTDSGIVSGPLFALMVTPPAPTCDQTITTVNGITGPNAVPDGDLATYSSNGAEDMGSKNLSGILTKIFGEIENGAYVASYRADQAGPAQVTADLPNGTQRTRTIEVCPAP